MQLEGKKKFRYTRCLGVIGVALLATGLTAGSSMATVTGACSNCHTMHDSQNGAALATHSSLSSTQANDSAHWNGNGSTLGGGLLGGAQDTLLKTDCVGCHSNAGPETIISDAGGNKVPIVYNIGAYPTGQELAGGNFNMVATDDNYGHNVLGISGVDGNMSEAPGNLNPCLSNSCHNSLATGDTAMSQLSGSVRKLNHNGCRACHNALSHHNVNDLSFRYLGGHAGTGLDVVQGGGPSGTGPNPFEAQDGNWEQGATATTAIHNTYLASTVSIGNPVTIAAFCSGCHGMFHAMGNNDVPGGGGGWLRQNGGDQNLDFQPTATSVPSNPWMRHPSSVNIPVAGGEYAPMVGSVQYNPLVPVARTPGSMSTPVIVPGDQVFCLSCHRAHASDQPDSLRFDYSTMRAHEGTGAGTGCFYCHTTKDDIS